MKEGRKIYLFFVMKIIFPLTPFTLTIFNDMSYGIFYYCETFGATARVRQNTQTR